jgi:hypothetical protein
MSRLAAYDTAHSQAPACDMGTDWPSVFTVQPRLPTLLITSIVVSASPSSARAVSTSKNLGST